MVHVFIDFGVFWLGGFYGKSQIAFLFEQDYSGKEHDTLPNLPNQHGTFKISCFMSVIEG